MLDDEAVLIGLGANLPGAWGPPRRALGAALERLEAVGVRIVRRSRLWWTRPVPDDGQPWYCNAVDLVATDLPAPALLALLLAVEAECGRVRSVANAPRVLDLDLLAYGRLLSADGAPLLPHPRLPERAFVLLPLADVAPAWRHPATGDGVRTMLTRLPADHGAEPAENPEDW